MSGASGRRRRILFFAEAVTLAHVARPYVLACGLPQDEYEVRFACDPRYNRLFPNAPFEQSPLSTVSSQAFLHALAKGSPLYNFAILQDYVREDLTVIDGFQPDAIVGDFRLSLSVSARLREIPYVAISNAYWSPHAEIDRLAPELPLTRWLGYRIGGTLFRWGSPVGFAIHARAHNRLQRRYGLPEFGSDVREVYTDGDHVLYADLSSLVPLRRTSPHHYFVGPIQWSPSSELPPWWEGIERCPRPVVYVTLGSSGDMGVLPTLIEGLSEMAGTVLVATAGRSDLGASTRNVLVADYLPGERAAHLADLIVCNGGSPTTYQALAAGKPVLGIPTNLDQCLNIAAVREAGLGQVLRAGKVTKHTVQQAAESTMRLSGSAKLRACSEEIRAADAVATLQQLLEASDACQRFVTA